MRKHLYIITITNAFTNKYRIRAFNEEDALRRLNMCLSLNALKDKGVIIKVNKVED